MPDIAINDWIAIGPWTAGSAKEAMDTPYLADEATVEPSDGDRTAPMASKDTPSAAAFSRSMSS